MEKLGKYKDKRITVIPNTTEKYISFSIDNIRFIDSLQFMNASLEKLVGNLAEDGKHKFVNMCKYIPDDEQQDLLLRKGVYPYDNVDGPNALEESKLPSKDKFFSMLSNQHITDEDYEHAQKVWSTFKCKSFGDYHDTYLKADVLQLADVFENFRSVCKQAYDLDPAHYFTAPGLSWDAMLRHTKVELDLIDDIDMYLMVEQGIRGGISMISHKFAKANNPYMEEYDPDQPPSYILYWDANNLHGWAMSEPLPTGNFSWIPEPEKLDVKNIPEDGDTGYILEVDMEYPHHLHDLHSDYPLAAEKKRIEYDDLSPYSQKLKEGLGMEGSYDKLVPNLHAKNKYIIHYRSLQQCLSLGLKLTKIHRAIAFDQSRWLKGYIDLNTEMRKEAKNTFEKNFFKLMNNSIFGKTMENVRNRINLELVHTEKRLKKVVSKPTFHQFRIINEDLTMVHLKKAELKLNKPIYVGMSILDLSKMLMYDFHYNYVKPKYTDAKLLFTDTDSLCYKINTNDIYQDMKEDSIHFDTSDYAKDHFLHSNENKKVLGKMKDECAGTVVKEFVGLRPKMYSMLYGEKEKKTAKGVGRSYMRDVKHSMYVKCLMENQPTTAHFNVIRSYVHQVFSEHVTKVALSPFDDKRYVLDDGVSTLAHGHYTCK